MTEVKMLLACFCVITNFIGSLSELNWNEDYIFEDSLDCYNSTTMQMSSWSNGGVFDCDWSPKNIVFDSGIMELKLTEKNTGANSSYLYSGAEYRTRNVYGYGLYLVKMKPAKNDGIVSSFFVYTGPASGTVWDEIDIEFLGKDTSKVQFNFFTNGVGNHEYLFDLGFDASEEFHEYGFLWTSSQIVWFVDGQSVYAVNSTDYDLPSTEGKIMMNLWNGIDSENINAWLNKYDGTTGLTAYYDSFEYVPLEEINCVNSNDEIVDVTPTVNELSDLLQTSFSQYAIKNRYDGTKQIYSNATYYTEGAYIYAKTENRIDNPKELTIEFYHKTGYLVSITPSLIDTDGKEYFLDNTTIVNEKTNHTISYDISNISAEIVEVRLYFNSELQNIGREKHAYGTILVEELYITN